MYTKEILLFLIKHLQV